MKKNLITIISLLVMLVQFPLMAENIFLRDGAIVEGKIVKETDSSISVKLGDNSKKTYKRSKILRIIYTQVYKKKVYIYKKNGAMTMAYQVNENQNSYTFRKDLYKPAEFSLSKDEVIFISRFPKETAAKPRIAVIDLAGKGVSKTVAAAVSDIIRSEIVNSDKFVVVERNQVNEILKEQGFQQSGCTDQECAVQIGKLISASKILTGEVNRLGRSIIITVRVVDVSLGVSKFSAREKSKSEEELDKAAERITKQLIDRILGKRPQEETEKPPVAEKTSPGLDIKTSYSYLSSLGNFQNLADTGIGVTVSISYNILGSLYAGLNFGYYQFPGKDTITKDITLIPFAANVRYDLNPFNRFFISPVISFGMVQATLTQDSDGADANGIFEYSKASAFEPHLRAGILLSYSIIDNLAINIGGFYNSIFEQDGQLNFLSYTAGIGFMF